MVPKGDPLALRAPRVLYLLMKHFGTMKLTHAFRGTLGPLFTVGAQLHPGPHNHQMAR